MGFYGILIAADGVIDASWKRKGRKMRARCLLFCVFISLVIGILAAPGHARIDPGTAVGIWLFDEDSGDTAEDSSRQANHGTLMNGPERVDGKLGKALSFNGANHVEVADSESLDIADAVTVSTLHR